MHISTNREPASLARAHAFTHTKIDKMGRLYDVFENVQDCHQYTHVSQGNIQLQTAWRCSEIVVAIQDFVRSRSCSHSELSERDLIIALGQDLISMGLIQVILPEPKSYV